MYPSPMYPSPLPWSGGSDCQFRLICAAPKRVYAWTAAQAGLVMYPSRQYDELSSCAVDV
jgi:hypothetical protein